MRDRNDPVFESSRYPIVRLPGENGELMNFDEDDMSVEEEKKEDDTRDAAVIGSERDSSTISPFTPKGLLKLMENTGNDISKWPDVGRKLLPYLKLDLMLHQQHAVCWMTQMENLGGMGINSMLWEERSFLDGGKFYYSPAIGQIRLGRPPCTVGGILSDEMGLGKTLELLCLIASSLDELKREAKEGGEYCTHATLLIVPPALVTQWMKEIKKSCGDSLKVAFMDVRTKHVDEDLVDVEGEGNDILVTTYRALDTTKTISYLKRFTWGRIALDEMQEIRSSTTQVARNCERLVCHRRWMISGTPIFEGIEDLRGELNFLRLEPYSANSEDGFFNFSILDHWNMHSLHGLETLRILSLLMLRRSKDMKIRLTGRSIMDQKKLTVEFAPVAQSASERALYCWMENRVSLELNQKEENARVLKSRSLCLRLLREICFSVTLINGGLGVPSQLRTLNSLMVKANRETISENLDYNRRNGRSKKRETNRVMNCDEALRFLSQVQAEANVREDFVTDQMVGRGQGVTNRNHAMDSVEDQVKQAQEDVNVAIKQQGDAKRKRAKAHWYFALEMVTMGALWTDHEACGVSPKFARLWKWRHLCSKIEERRKLLTKLEKKQRKCQDEENEDTKQKLMEDIDHIQMEIFCLGFQVESDENEVEEISGSKQILPAMLVRGWRPRASFAEDIQTSNPSFAWSHPFTLRLDNIPAQVSPEDVKAAVIEGAKKENLVREKLERLSKMLQNAAGTSNEDGLREEIAKVEESLQDAIADDQQLHPPQVIRIASSNTPSTPDWKAFVKISDEMVYRQLSRLAESKIGITLKSAEVVPRVQDALAKAEEEFNQAESENKVHPCAKNKKRETVARKILEKAKLGLVIKFDDASSDATSHVIMSRAVGQTRGEAPRSSTALVKSCFDAIARATDTLETSAASLEAGRSTLARLMPAMTSGFFVSQDLAKMSAYEILETLRERDFDKTSCPICLSPFARSSSSAPPNKPVVAMTSCGHFYCIECIEAHTQKCIAESRPVQCPNCRRGYCLSSDVIHVDHLATKFNQEHEEMRNEAKERVREASAMLECSDGVISGELWHALFLSFDLPFEVSTRAHHLHTALPRDFLAHMRAATGMKLDCKSRDMPSSNDELQQSFTAGLSSKVQALLGDIPFGEHSVVFSSSKDGVLHLATVIKAKGIECFSLYTGQKTEETEEAVATWENVELDVSKKGPVLVVQAGAAASGLTLTAASKLFLMQPFMRQEEETQAYARCHRYGQEKDVHVKIYYVPVSVESRLLAWRARAAKKMTDGNERSKSSTNYVFTQLFEDEKEYSDVEDDGMMLEEEVVDKKDAGNKKEKEPDRNVASEEENVEDDEDYRRNLFLLGLVDKDGNPVGVEEDDEKNGDDDDEEEARNNDRKMPARRFALV